MGKKEASSLGLPILALDPLGVLLRLMCRETGYTAAGWLGALAREVAIQLGFCACTAILAFPPPLGVGRAAPNTAVAERRSRSLSFDHAPPKSEIKPDCESQPHGYHSLKKKKSSSLPWKPLQKGSAIAPLSSTFC